MNQSTTNPEPHVTVRKAGMILAALLAGIVTTQALPDVHPLAAYRPPAQVSSTEVFRHATSKSPGHDASRDLTGIDVDVRRLAMLGCIC